ncbi:uncharacterized protein LOC135950462 [Calliphora vicina]|uniref:uncharacterized protein LOC135950462 n=1 Tax=Calliphora vicina TaxID=7373 RepID=UPI00325AF34B
MATSEELGSASSLIPTEVSRVTVRVPPFWRQNPKLWFRQLESQFVTSGITSDTTKYHTLVGSIESNILNHVSHIVEAPPAENKYETLKCSLLNEFIESEEKRLRQLLENISVGDKKPSALLREMRALASGKVSEDLLKTLWIQRLPNTTKAILSVSNDTIDKLCLIADKIHDQSDPTINAVSVNNDERISNLENTIQEIFSNIDALSIDNHRRNRSSSRNLSRNRTRSPSEKSFCWYHHKFRYRATKCRSPCSYKLSENN